MNNFCFDADVAIEVVVMFAKRSLIQHNTPQHMQYNTIHHNTTQHS